MSGGARLFDCPRRFKYVSLFSGIEAASAAWASLGWEPVAFSEIEPFPSAELKHHFPDVPNLGDITKANWKKYRGRCDLVVGGSPCQSFSIAGKREGLSGESGLMFEYIRAVREIRPRWFLWENVPGALTSEGGEAFGQLLKEMDDIGYGMAWRILDAQFFGVPQRRRRVFLVGCFGDPERAAKVFFERECLCGDFAPSKEKRKELAAALAEGSGIGCEPMMPSVLCRASGQSNAETLDQLRPTLAARQYKDPPIVTGETCGTLCSSDYKGVGNQYVDDGKLVVDKNETQYYVRRLTPTECERLQGFTDGWTDIEVGGKRANDAPRYKALGNTMAVPVMRWIGQRIDKQIRLEDL